MRQAALCRVAGCGWTTEEEADTASAGLRLDAALVEHLVGEHGPRVLADLVVSAWQGREPEERAIRSAMGLLEPLVALPAAVRPPAAGERRGGARRRGFRSSRGRRSIAAVLHDALRRSPSPLATSELEAIADRAAPGLSRSAASVALQSLGKRGLAKRIGRGRWSAA